MSTSWEYELMPDSDELKCISDELAPGGAAHVLEAQVNALAAVRASGDLGVALDMLDVEAGTGLDDRSLDGVAYSAVGVQGRLIMRRRAFCCLRWQTLASSSLRRT